jgi:hypothetical protein
LQRTCFKPEHDVLIVAWANVRSAPPMQNVQYHHSKHQHKRKRVGATAQALLRSP